MQYPLDHEYAYENCPTAMAMLSGLTPTELREGLPPAYHYSIAPALQMDIQTPEILPNYIKELH